MGLYVKGAGRLVNKKMPRVKAARSAPEGFSLYGGIILSPAAGPGSFLEFTKTGLSHAKATPAAARREGG